MRPIKIKICGVTTVEDVAFAAACGVDALGLNFYPKSPRFLSTAQAEDLLEEWPMFVSAVGLFVDTPDDTIRETMSRHGLHAAQTYPKESESSTLDRTTHIPAFRVQDRSTLAIVSEYVSRHRPAAVLLDSFVPGSMGGTGHPAPWELLAGFDPGVPVILAGGLTPDNVAEAVRIVKPWGVDVASGVEAAPGKKDRGKVRAFIQTVRAVETSISLEPTDSC